MTKTQSWAAGESARPLSTTLLHLLAAGLHGASQLLTRLAERLSSDQAFATPLLATVEFHAFHCEGGAPEGALYVDGVLVGWLPGVKRL